METFRRINGYLEVGESPNFTLPIVACFWMKPDHTRSIIFDFDHCPSCGEHQFSLLFLTATSGSCLKNLPPRTWHAVFLGSCSMCHMICHFWALLEGYWLLTQVIASPQFVTCSNMYKWMLWLLNHVFKWVRPMLLASHIRDRYLSQLSAATP